MRILTVIFVTFVFWAALLWRFLPEEPFASSVVSISQPAGSDPVNYYTASKIVTGLDFLRKVLPAGSDAQVQQLQSSIETSVDEQKGLIEIRVKDKDLTKAADMANRLAREFLLADIGTGKETARNRQDYFQRQVRVAQDGLDVLQKQILEVRGHLIQPGIQPEEEAQWRMKQEDLENQLRDQEQQFRQLNMDFQNARLEEAAQTPGITLVKSAVPGRSGRAGLSTKKVPILAFLLSLVSTWIYRFLTRKS